MQCLRNGDRVMIRIIGRKGFQSELSMEKTVEDIMRELDLKEQSFVCVRNGSPVTRFDMLKPSDDVTFLEIFSGG